MTKSIDDSCWIVAIAYRLDEVILPIPKDCELKERITQIVKRSIDDRIEARELARQACMELVNFSSKQVLFL